MSGVVLIAAVTVRMPYVSGFKCLRLLYRTAVNLYESVNTPKTVRVSVAEHMCPVCALDPTTSACSRVTVLIVVGKGLRRNGVRFFLLRRLRRRFLPSSSFLPPSCGRFLPSSTLRFFLFAASGGGFFLLPPFFPASNAVSSFFSASSGGFFLLPSSQAPLFSRMAQERVRSLNWLVVSRSQLSDVERRKEETFLSRSSPPPMDSPAPPASLVNLMPPLLAQDFSGHCAHENALSTRKSKEDSDPITRVRKTFEVTEAVLSARVLSTPSPTLGHSSGPPPAALGGKGDLPRMCVSH